MDEDEIYVDDIPGNSRRQKQRRRNELRLNYNSDSEEEVEQENDEDVKEPTDKLKEVDVNENDGSDDDMFASDKEEDEEEEKLEDTSKANTEVPIKNLNELDMDQFEKEEGIDDYIQSEEGGSDVDDNDPDKIKYFTNIEEMDNIDDSIQVKKGNWKPKIEAFNLREEAEDGTFDLEGNYTRKEPQSDDEDHWLDSTKRSDIENARKSQLEREKLAKIKKKAQISMSTTELIEQLIPILEPAETPLELLARLAPKQSRRKRNLSKHEHSSSNNASVILMVTEVVEALISDKAVSDAYDLSREEYLRMYKNETGVEYKIVTKKRPRESSDNEDENNEDDYGTKIWEFKWNGQEEINGPYSEYEMKYWKESYFENSVQVRKIGEELFQDVANVEFE